MPAQIYVETVIAADLETVWERTQDPMEHVRWDVRFSRTTPEESDENDDDNTPTHFTYERVTPLHTVRGIGISIGERRRPDGTRTSALKFHTRDRLSPIAAGRGYWRYVPTPDGVRFVTGYDYTPGWGPLDVLVRPLIGWATAFSFDRLRIWCERGEEPEQWPLHSAMWFWNPHRPRASRCLRVPRGARRRDDHLAQAPSSLADLPEASAKEAR